MDQVKNDQMKSVIGISLITAICVIGDAMLYIVLPLYWQDFGLTALWQIGILLSINRFIRLPLNPFIGWIYRKITIRTGVIIAICITILTTFAYGFAQNFYLLFIARAMWGIAWSFLRLGGFLTVITSSSSHNRGYLMGKYNGLWGLGGLVGMLSGGFLVSIISIQLLCAGLASIAFCSFLLLKYIPIQKAEQENNKPVMSYHSAQSQHLPQDIPWWKQSQVLFVLAAGLCMAMVFFGIYLSTLSMLIEQQIASFMLFGIVISSAALAGLLQAIRWSWDPFLAPWIGSKSDQTLGRKPFIIFALFVASMSILFATLELSLWAFLLSILALQFASTMIVTLTDSATSDVASRTSHVGVMTSYTVAVDVGAALGPLIAFIMIDNWGIMTLYWFTSGFLAVMGLSWMAFKETKIEKELSVS